MLFQRCLARHSAQIALMLICSSLGLFAGCDSETRGLARRPVEISDVPDDVMAAAKKKLPDVEFADGWKNLDKAGKLHSYEIRGRNKNGKIREVRVSPTGEILEVE